MAKIPAIDTEYLVEFLVRLLNVSSPTGYTEQAITLLEKELTPYSQLTLCRTIKGALVAVWESLKSESPRALTAHIDTLGGMVKEIKSSGRLAITRIGGLLMPAVENEGCWVHTTKGKKIRGAFLVNSASAHVYGKKAAEDKRDENGMEIRLDALTQSDEDTRRLGIQVGDFISFDPRVEQLS